jgi:enoyl-CoA hydratase/carnithine racemase
VTQIVQTRRQGHILVVEMRREEKRNAVNQDLAYGIDAALNTLDDDPDLWAGILTGTPQVFSAGTDLAAGERAATERGGSYGVIQRDRRKPLVAAVEGPALGGGLEIVLACDLVVASTTARFGLPEVTRGVLPTCAALFRGPRAIPVNMAKELILTGVPIGAQRAYELGLVNRVTEPGRAVEVAVELAQQICTNAPLSVQACLAAVNQVLAVHDELGWQATREAPSSIQGTEDMKEGVAAFFERRPPKWTGR